MPSKPGFAATATSLFGLVILYVADRVIKIGFYIAPDLFEGFFLWAPWPTMVYLNDGIVFGIELPFWLILSVSIILLLAVGSYLFQAVAQHYTLQVWGWGLVFAGGFSNLWDRLQYQAVVDWLVMPWGAVINLADVFIFVGIAAMLVQQTFMRTKAE